MGNTNHRKKVSIDEIRESLRDEYQSRGIDVDSIGIMALVDVENMGWCKDGSTRWYHFTNESGEPCVYFKY